VNANQVILPGDKVATWKDIVFLHPLIHVGNGWFVEKAKTGLIRTRHLGTFPKGQQFRVMQRPAAHEAPNVIRRALSRLGWEKYHPVDANCQHFANEVMTGERKSEQVEAIVGVASVAAIALLAYALFKK
jgi:hypothetical protein